MSNNLPTLLAELSEVAPQICQRKETEFAGTWYKVGDYEFGHDLWVDGEFLADYPNCMVRGLPAYDWLQGALMRVVEGKGWYWELRYWKPRGKYQAEVANYTAWNSNPTEALLTALIMALKEVEK